MAFASSFLAPTKFEPWSDLICWMGPRIAVKHLNALMKASVVMSSNCFMCTAREFMQVNITAYLFSSFLLSLTVNGPKQSIPQYAKGGVDSTLSSGDLPSSGLLLVVAVVCIVRIYKCVRLLQH